MKYLTWLARMTFGCWMVANGLMHFLHLWPQPMGSTPLSAEFTSALIDSRLFIFVKAIEVIGGVAVLAGLYVPLWAVICMPISFVIFYYGEFLEGSSTHHGAIFVLGPNLIICLGYWNSYKAMLAPRAKPSATAWSFPAPAGTRPSVAG